MSQFSAPAQRRELIILFALATMNFCHVLDFMIMMPLGPQLMRLFSIDATKFGFLVSSYTFSAAIAGFVGSFFVDKFDRKYALLFVFFGFMLGTLSCALANTYSMLIAARIVSGAFGGLVGALLLAIVGDIIPVERRGHATGLLMGAFSLASVVGIPVGLFLAQEFQWHAPFYAIVLASCCALPIVWILLPNINEHLGKTAAKSPYAEFLAVVSYKPHQLSFLLIGTLMVGGFTVIPFISTYAVSNIGVPEEKLSLIYMCGGLATFFSAPFIGTLADKFGNAKVYPILVGISVVVILVLTNMPQAPLLVALVVTTAFMIFVSGRMIVAFNMVNSCVKPEMRGGFMSLNSSVQQLSSGAASFLASFIVFQPPQSPMQGFRETGAIAVLGNLLSLYFMYKLAKLKENERHST